MPDSSLRVKLCFFLLSSFRFCPPLKNDGTRCYCEEVDRAGCQERGGNHRIEIVDKRNRKENKIVFGKQGVGSICLVFA